MKLILNLGFLLCLLVLTILWHIDLQGKIESLQEQVEALKQTQRPLIVVSGNFTDIVCGKDQVLVVERNVGDRKINY